jgi:hypothetical protein
VTPHGLYTAGLVLVRPDQHVAWRGDQVEDAEALLAAVTGAGAHLVAPAGAG